MARDARLDEPMSDARLREIRKGIEFNQMGMDEDEALFAVSDLLAEVTRLRATLDVQAAREAALVEVVRAVAEADNSDNSVCYQLCDYSMHGDWMIKHEAPCVVKQARALLATEPTDATTAERE